MIKTDIVKIDFEKPDKKIIKIAARIIKTGGLVVFPTETVYGIAADSTNKKAVARLNRIKKRPAGKSYTVQIADKKDIRRYVKNIPSSVRLILQKYWPGPLTAILPKKTGGKIGLRIPDHKVARALLREVGRPVIVPSANLGGRKSPRTATEAAGQLAGLVELILDAGAARYGIDSTVVDFTVSPPKILRQGKLAIKFVTGG